MSAAACMKRFCTAGNKEPNEDAIWLMDLFSQIDKNGNVKIFAAYKITFEGTDAKQDKNRMSPKIINVEFIPDKGETCRT